MSDEMKTATRFDNPAVQGYRELVVWQKGIEVAKQTYLLTRTFPTEEKFGLTSQMRRASVSIPSNIAEGQARHTTGEFIQFISHAEGSVAELATQFHLAIELGFLTAEPAAPTLVLLEEIRRMLNGLRRKLSQTA
jgi:four helix bundle protein